MKPSLIVHSVVFITEVLITLIYFPSTVTVWIIRDSLCPAWCHRAAGTTGSNLGVSDLCVRWCVGGECGGKAFSSSSPTPCEEEQHHALLIHCGRNVKLGNMMDDLHQLNASTLT